MNKIKIDLSFNNRILSKIKYKFYKKRLVLFEIYYYNIKETKKVGKNEKNFKSKQNRTNTK